MSVDSLALEDYDYFEEVDEVWKIFFIINLYSLYLLF